MTETLATEKPSDNDQEERAAADSLHDGWNLVHHSGYPRLDTPGTEAPWGCVL